MSSFDEPAWDERYRSRPAVWSGRPNPQLVAEASDLAPGTAVDVGSGEGADALWLAARGWQVTAVDFSTVALQRGAEQAQALGPEIAGRIDWVHADLTTWAPGAGRFDLVSAQFMHLPTEPRQALYARLAGAVRAGGVLLVVGHDVSDVHTSMHRPDLPDLFFTATQIADALAPEEWEILAADRRARTAVDPEGHETTTHDAVLTARRR